MKKWFSYYSLRLPIILAYMLQQVEYNPTKFIRWVMRRPDLNRVMRRQTLVWTHKARVLVALISFFYLFYIIIAVWNLIILPIFGLITFLLTPFLLIFLTYLIVMAAWLYYEEPRRRRLVKQATKLFSDHPGIIIAIAGSYGKTSMKEILLTVLSQGKKVAATPGNKNVPVSHASWVKKLKGDEEVLLIEFGEGAPGDVKNLAKLTHPDYGVITGLAPNHLDQYKDVDSLAQDLLSLGDFVSSSKLFINNTSHSFKGYELKGHAINGDRILGWKIERIKVDIEGTSFRMKEKNKTLDLQSGLLGRHQVAPLALAAAIADKLGLSNKEIVQGVAATVPFEHRMQPRNLNGAWIIDDAYNGSLEGIRAGLELLKTLPARRKIYVTPGLVDQGVETERVHHEIGLLISAANPDRVVLMQNSVTQLMLKGIEEGGYKGELQIENDPLGYYTNLEHIVASGDLVILQNDWTDNYS
jgi:UDP-N-acetylmuramoyl-tripeptide--D-alanyl-D-alanine ligase